MKANARPERFGLRPYHILQGPLQLYRKLFKNTAEQEKRI
jgi:hypothetical protein